MTKVLSILEILIFCIKETIWIKVKTMTTIEEELELTMIQQEKDHIVLDKDHLNDQTYHSDKTTIDLTTINAITIILTINNGTNNNRLIQFNIINKTTSQILEMKFRNWIIN